MARLVAITGVVVVVILGLVALEFYGQRRPMDRELHRAAGQDFAKIARGHYLVTAADCASCHDRPGTGEAMAGGRPIETPFGVVVAPNVTPDRDTGIGAWTDDQFDAALRQGRRRDGKRLYPAMPFPYYTKMSRDDVLAIRTYLDTIKQVHHKVEPNQLPFPFDVRAGIMAWDALYFTAGEFKPDSGKSAEWNRGAYLVEGPAHCGACHTPKTLLGGDETSETLRGSILQGWFAPSITNNVRRGLGRWSADDIVAYLKTGHNRFTAATGPMAEEVTLASAHMSDADLRAIATYLKSVPGEADDAPAPEAGSATMTAGGAVYQQMCSSCHSVDGHGVASLFPSLERSAMVQSRDPTSLIRIVLRGARSAATAAEPTGPAMPAFGWQLGDEKVADVITYIRNNFGNAATAVNSDDVRRARASLASRND